MSTGSLISLLRIFNLHHIPARYAGRICILDGTAFAGVKINFQMQGPTRKMLTTN